MRVIDTAVADVKIIEPAVFHDERGFFYESYNAEKFSTITGVSPNFVQDNHSKSVRGVVRGLHYQIEHPQGKLVRVTAGEVFDVAVDIRRSSPTFGQHVSVLLSAENKRMLWVPEGFAHGFMALTDDVEFLYKTTDVWFKQHERTLLWNDPVLDIAWPLARVNAQPRVNAKDAEGAVLKDADCFA
jgi:dTDP-4-dehydrorhamnose 3,5-epimerase